MKRTYLAEASLKELKNSLKVAKERKKYFENYAENLKKGYETGRISRNVYIETLHKHFDGKSLSEWISYYNHTIKDYEEQIKKSTGRILGKSFLILLFSALIIISLFSLNLYPRFQLVGFTISDYESGIITETDAIVDTVQYEAILGQTVKWKKIISLDSPEKATIILPAEAENISIQKITESLKDSYSEQEEVLEKQTNKIGPFQQEPLLSETEIEEQKEKENEEEIRGQETPFTITGGVILETSKGGFLLSFFRNIGRMTGLAISEPTQVLGIEIETDNITTEYEIEYETPAPYSEEKEIARGKQVKIIGPETIRYENVLVFTDLDENLKIVDADRIKIYWVEGNSYINPSSVEDRDNNGIYDYVEWIAPHLSTQTFNIIVIIKAEHLDENRNFIQDIYEEVRELDDIWSPTISDNEYVRVTFERNLTNQNDITIFPRVVSGEPKIEIYEIDGSEIVAEFTSITSNQYNKIYLTNLISESQNIFDLRILDGSIEFDHIIDPGITSCSSGVCTVIFNASGSDSFTVPLGVTEIQIEAWGAGGSGGTAGVNNAGGGGAGGQYAKANITVAGGQTFSLNIPDVTAASSNWGANSTFYNATTTYVRAVGGAPGVSAANGAGGQGSTVNGIANGAGGVIFAGGNGAAGVSRKGGGGGGGAGSSGSGGNASGETAGTGTQQFGGNGGAGASGNNIVGGPGSDFGGGGGGGNNRDGGTGAQGMLRITYVEPVDTESPQYSSLTATPSSPTTYSFGQTIEFNSTWTDNQDGVHTVIINFNGVNSTVARASGTALNGVYRFTISGLSVGSYNYYWWANDSASPANANQTGSQSYTINQNSGACDVLFNETSPITYPGSFRVWSNCNSADITLYRNGSIITNNTEQILSAGTYNFTVIRTDQQNYTNFYDEEVFVVNQGTGQIILKLNDTEGNINLDYPGQVNASAYSSTGQTIILYRNTTDVTSQNNLFQNLAASYWNFTAIAEENQNYTSASITRFATLNRATTSLSLTGTSPIEYGTLGDVEGSNCPVQLTCNLYREGVIVDNPDTAILGVGIYNYVYNTTGNENYTSDSKNFELTVNANSGACDVLFNETSPITYPGSFRVWSNCNSNDITLYRNGSIITNNTEQILSAGTYNFTVIRTDQQNYTNFYDEEVFVVNQGTGQITLKLNDTEGNINLDYPGQVNASAYSSTGQTIILYRNTTDVTSQNNLFQNLAASYWNFTAIAEENQNYTSASITRFATLNRATPTASLTNDRDWTFTYDGTPANIGISESNNGDSDVTYVLWKDDENVGSTDSQAAAGVFNYKINTTGGQNYSSADNLDTNTLTINKATSSVQTFVNNTRENIQILESSEIWLNVTQITGDSGATLRLYRNETLLNQGTSPLSNFTMFDTLGVYNITGFYVESENYTGSFETWYVTVEPSNMPPTIPDVYINETYTPFEGGTRSVIFNFTAEDENGIENLNDATARAYFQRAGEPTRFNESCIAAESSGNQKNYTCTIGMEYFDEAGEWIVNVSIEDNEGEYVENSSASFTYNIYWGMTMFPTALTWPSPVNVSDVDIPSENHPIIINNTGNAIVDINITAFNLRGIDNINYFIFANNFTVDNVASGCSGTAMQNDTSLKVANALLGRGNNSLNYENSTSGQETLYFCLKGLPSGIIAQEYSTSAYGSWEIKILLVALIPARRKKKKEIKNDKLMRALDLILNELKEEYSLNKKELTEIMVERLKEKYKISKKDILDLIREKINIPSTIFSKELGALESITKYMKENLKMSYREIAKELGRDERTIWTAYKKANEKQKEPLKIKETKIFFPISAFENKKLTVLESMIIYLKEKGFNFKEIADMLDRDQRNIWTIYSKAKSKIIDNS